ncbi:MAG: hypothetical protein GX539_02490, partial [Candidatus Cloacimonetes bacterium]|nr:hypothetical protein [Candidatus Cloacimonadota bacterium]
MSAHLEDPRRAIPSIDRLLSSAAFAALVSTVPRSRVVAALQAVQDDVRGRILAGEGD